MRRTDALFQLIKSLNRAEKRNYKLLTQLTAGDKKYLKLFDAIDKQEEYDQEKLIQQFQDENFTKQFSVAKNYLYNSILRSLSYFHKGSDAELNGLSMQVKILIDKNLYPHARKLLRKALQKAEKQEKFNLQMDLLHLKREILQSTQNYKNFQYFSSEIRQKERKVFEKLSNYLDYQHLFDYVYHVLTFNYGANMEEARKELEQVLEEEVLQSPKAARSVRARIRYYQIHRSILHYQGEFKKALEYADKIVETYENNPEIKETQIHEYIKAIFHQSGGNYIIRHMDKSMDILRELKKNKYRSFKAKMEVFQKYSIHSLIHHSNGGDIPNGMQVVEEVGEGLAEFSGALKKSDEFLLLYFSAIMCLVAGEYSLALKWVNRFLNEPRTEVREDLQCMARLLNLLIHYELGNFELVEHSLKSSYRFIFKKKQENGRFPAFEGQILRSIRKIIESTSVEEQRECFEEFLEGIDSLADNPHATIAANFLDIRSWIVSKLEAKPLAVVKAENMQASLEAWRTRESSS